MNTYPMIPTTPECGAPCAEFEALAHTVSMLKNYNGKLEAEAVALHACLLQRDVELRARAETITQLRSELESVRSGSAKVCRELREENAALRTLLSRWERWATAHGHDVGILVNTRAAFAQGGAK